MKRSIKSLLVALVVSLSLAVPVLAGPDKGGPPQDILDLAEQGSLPAMNILGRIYALGAGVPQDYAEALKWLRKAAEQGFALSQIYLGDMYNKGQGVPQDYVEAHKWMNLAAAQGDKDAAKSRDAFARKMTPAQIAEAQRLAREWKPKK